MIVVYAGGHISDGDHNPADSFHGPAIGFTVMVGAFAVGGISGGAFNPAVAIGAASMGLAWPTIWLYLLAELAAGAIAGLAFRALDSTDK